MQAANGETGSGAAAAPAASSSPTDGTAAASVASIGRKLSATAKEFSPTGLFDAHQPTPLRYPLPPHVPTTAAAGHPHAHSHAHSHTSPPPVDDPCDEAEDEEELEQLVAAAASEENAADGSRSRPRDLSMVTRALQRQIEFYFSPPSLWQDAFLQEEMRKVRGFRYRTAKQ